ncbi:hypothetical protein [Candidatus Palauibacter sp.]|uniref:hypothetical protein n=1 Tax=Candidatus Palauibacter sp. TaxID=3101350 RepID=UPI003AF22BC5
MTSTTPVRSDDLGVPRRSSSIKSDADEKSFDVMKWLRETRDRINEEIVDTSGEELREQFSRRPRDPVLAGLFDRRKVPEGRKVPALATEG